MLKSNLATRPFYNDRLVAIVIGVIGAGALALTGFNATQLLSLSKERAKLVASIEKDETEAHQLELKAAGLKSAIDLPGMQRLRFGAHEANDLIDRRTFSWTEFLSIIEKTLPDGSRMVEVAPKPEKGVMHVTIIVVSKSAENLFTFIESLEKTGAFKDVVPTQRNPNEDGTETAEVDAIYLAPVGDVPQPPRKSGKGRP